MKTLARSMSTKRNKLLIYKVSQVSTSIRPMSRRRTQLPLRLTSDSDMIVTEQAAGHVRASAVNTLDAYLKVEIYNHVIDKSVSELKHRFSDKNREIFLAVGALLPRTSKFLDVDLLMPMARYYKSNAEDFIMEIARTAEAHDSTKDSRWNVASFEEGEAGSRQAPVCVTVTARRSC